MEQLRLGLTLSIVGPREHLLDMPEWPMALRIAVGTDVEPAEEEQEALVIRTLPWTVWRDLSGARVTLAVQPAQGGAPVLHQRDVMAPLAEEASFLAGLKTAVEEGGARLARQGALKFAFAPEELVDQDPPAADGAGAAGGACQPVQWPGLVATLQTLASPTPSALHCIWYFTVPRDMLVETDGTARDVYLSAAPSEVEGAAHAGVAIGPTVGKYPVHEHAYAGAAAAGQCQGLRLHSVIKHDVDELDNYWLAIHDSGDDSLLDLGARLDAACAPEAPLSVLSAQELGALVAAEVDQGAGRHYTRAATAQEVAIATDHWKNILKAKGGAAETRARLLRAASNARDSQADAARVEYRRVVDGMLASLAPAPSGSTGVRLALRADDAQRRALAASAQERLFPRGAPQRSAPSAADGIDLMVGDTTHRLRHVDTDSDNGVDDVAQIQLFGRRSSTQELLEVEAAAGGAGWHALSAARYQLPDSAALSFERLLGMTATYQDDVLCRELSYVGANIACEHPLGGVHRDQPGAGTPEPASFVLAAPRSVACTGGALRSLPLRYGDFYEFAAAVRDRAGGMAAELTGAHPWIADLGKIAALEPPQRNRVRFVRRSAPGDCSIGPGPQTAWPQTPANVALRCLEDLPDHPGRPAPAVIFLVPDDPERFAAAPAPAGPQPARYTFAVEAPRASEHVLLRWNMPPTNLPPQARAAAVEALQENLVAIFLERDERIADDGAAAPVPHHLGGAAGSDFLPTDPAVAKLGVHWWFGSGGKGAALLDAARAEVTVAAGTPGTPGDGRRFTVGEGDFLRLSFHALVSSADLDRFDQATLDTHLVPEDGAGPVWPGYRAFEGSEVYVETASGALPAPEAQLLAVHEDQQGNVVLTYDFAGADDLHLNVQHVYVGSERWIWRNLPIPPEPGHGGAADRQRRLASGPPLDLMDLQLRDRSEPVRHFDRLSAIDDGFIGRKDQVLEYPRKASAPVILAVDARDEHAHADYLRYRLAFRSRYAPVLKQPLSGWSDPRRIACGFRGNTARIKPPRVLTVIPLTQAMPAPGAPQQEQDAPPFLILLDELWFREHGIGERLVARVARVKPEIPETPAQAPTELRYGPLPDHRLDAPAPDALAGREQLDVFGPFGMSHESGGSQALANATAFVVYPPSGTPPHFSLFVEFARVLDLPTAAPGAAPPSSEYTEAVALYSLPDMSALALGDRRDQPLRLRPRTGGYACAGASRLLPFPGAAGEVLQQYRYVLLLGHHVRDGGRAVDVFLPAEAMWLAPHGSAGELHAHWLGGATHDARALGFNAGVVLEILLNGRYPDQHPLGDASDVKQLFRLMLDDGPRSGAARTVGKDVTDAPGMIRRSSDWFKVTIESS